MKKAILLLLFGSLFAINSLAQDTQDEAKRADIKKMIYLLNSDKLIDGITNNMLNLLKQQAQTQMKDEKQRKVFEEYSEFLVAETKILSKKLIDEESVNIYDKYLTHKEVKDLIKFYKTKTGQKFIQVTPEISSDLMKAMSEKYLPEFQEKLKNKMQKLIQKGKEQEQQQEEQE